MRQIQKTLYILRENQYIHCDGGSIIVRQKDKELTRISAASLEQIVLMTNCTISSYMVKFCNDHSITLSIISPHGRMYGRIIGENYGSVILRKKQYDLEENRKIIFVRDILLGKLANERSVLMRCAKDAADEDAEVLYRASENIQRQIGNLRDLSDMESLRGLEGAAATTYFSAFDHMLKVKDQTMLFRRRSRRPAENPCNALMSLFYTLFTIDCEAALENCGLDSYYGFLHALRPGRASLACDLIEEFRASFVDKFIITLLNRKQVVSDDFVDKQEGIQLKPSSLKKVLALWEENKSGITEYPLSKSKGERKVVPYLQAQLMAQYIRGDIDDYPPYLWR